MLRVHEVAEILAYSQNTVRKKIHDGDIHAVRVGKKGDWRIPFESLQPYVNAAAMRAILRRRAQKKETNDRARY